MAAGPDKSRENQSVLTHLTREELIEQVQSLQEELSMSRAFAHLAENSAEDAALLWRGRSRFLAEKVMPVRLMPVERESLNPDKSENLIIDGDNLVLSQPRNRKGLEAKGRTDGLGPSLRKSVWVIVIWRLTEY